jgi:oxaloacetate decarboxylase gamma subunit
MYTPAMDATLLWHGLELMLAGMGTVFLFLTLLVFATLLMSRLVLRWDGAPATATVDHGGRGPLPADLPAPEEVAAIAAAIEQHRRRH